MSKTQVGVVKTSPAIVFDDYSRVMRICNYQKYLPKDKTTIIKLNLSWSLYYPACSTEPWQIEGILKTLREDGYNDILVMENKTVVTDPLKGLKENRWAKILKRYDVEFVPLMDVEWVPSDNIIKADLPAIREIFGDSHRIPEPFIGTNVIHPPTMKTHGHTTITGAMKNAFGGLITERRHHCHKLIHEILVDLLKIQKEIHTGIFAVMDGTVCGNGKGPRTMKPEIHNYLLASDDQVAIDSVAAKMMGFNPEDIDFIRIAAEAGLGNMYPEGVEIIGEDVSGVDFGFEVGESPVVWGDKLFRKGRLSFLEPLLFHTPLFKLAILGSALYHDYLWYPLIGKSRIKRFKETEWGRLLETYPY